jgi:solute carrier family 25 ornithine transporter 2/15
LAGSAGGIALWTAIFPADVVKSRMQIQGGTAKQVTMDVLKNDGKLFMTVYNNSTQF